MRPLRPEGVMHRSRILFALAIAAALTSPFLGAGAAQAAPTKYYIDCSKSTSGDGTAAKPWRSLAAANTHGTFAPGEQILLKRGTTCKGRLAPTGNGTASSPITIGAYGSGTKPTVAGGGTPNRTGAVQLTNSAYWTIQDLRVTNRTKTTTSSSYRSGVLLKNLRGGHLTGLTIQRLTVEDVVSNPTYRGDNPRHWGGISSLTSGGVNDGFVGMRVLANQIRNVSRTGIASVNVEYSNGADRDVRISGNSINRPKGDSIIVQGAAGARIDHNLSAVGASFWPCPQCKGISPQTANAAIWPIYSNDVRIDHNEVYGTHARGGDGEAFSLDASARRVVVEYNYIHDNEGGGLLFCGSIDATVRFNIFENNKKSAIAFIGTYPSKNSSIYNNTIYASRGTGANVVRTFNGLRGSGISFKNNLVYSYGPGKYLWPTKPKTAANQLIGTHATGRPTGSGTVWRDPGLKRPGSGGVGFKTLGGYRPKMSSTFPKGVAISKNVTRDFFGKKINPAKPPRGAAG